MKTKEISIDDLMSFEEEKSEVTVKIEKFIAPDGTQQYKTIDLKINEDNDILKNDSGLTDDIRKYNENTEEYKVNFKKLFKDVLNKRSELVYNEEELKHPLKNKICIHCKTGKTILEEAYDKWLVCTECGHIVLGFIPTPAQSESWYMPKRYTLDVGAVGSGKTTKNVNEMIFLGINTPNGQGLLGAHQMPQLQSTTLVEFFMWLPRQLIKNYNKRDGTVTLINGFIYLLRPLMDEQRIKSLNLCYVHITEADGLNFKVFNQLKKRLRNTKAKFGNHDLRKILMDTNPNINWVAEEFAFKASLIRGGKKGCSTEEDYFPFLNPDRNKFYGLYTSTIDDNPYLPKTYKEELAEGMDENEKKRVLYGSLLFSEGLVIDNFEKAIIYNFKSRGDALKEGSIDFGIADRTFILFGEWVLNSESGIPLHIPKLVIYKEVFERNRTIDFYANEILDEQGRWMHKEMNYTKPMQGDPSGRNRTDTETGKDWTTRFKIYKDSFGVRIVKSDAITGNLIADSVAVFKSLIDQDILKISKEGCPELIKQLKNYRYKEDGKPEQRIGVDGTDAARYITRAIPTKIELLRKVLYNKIEMLSRRSLLLYKGERTYIKKDTSRIDFFKGDQKRFLDKQNETRKPTVAELYEI